MAEEGTWALDSRSEVRPEHGTAHLEALALRLRAEGWYARIIAAEGRPALLRVVNLLTPPLNDDLSVRWDQAGLSWFCWSFGERIAHTGNLDLAAARITQVLGRPSR